MKFPAVMNLTRRNAVIRVSVRSARVRLAAACHRFAATDADLPKVPLASQARSVSAVLNAAYVACGARRFYGYAHAP